MTTRARNRYGGVGVSPIAEAAEEAPQETPPSEAQTEPAQSQSGTAVAELPARAPAKPMSPWNVVLLDDDSHSYEYVIRMMRSLFGHNDESAYKIAQHVDNDGRAICMTTHKELAELKRDQITAFGRDPMMAECKGSMTAVIEPAEA